jgi:oxygen-independent coproporphyrinogen III oxidase
MVVFRMMPRGPLPRGFLHNRTVKRSSPQVPGGGGTQALQCRRQLASKALQEGFWAPPTEEDQQTYNARQVFEAGVRHHHTANTAYPIAHGTTIKPYRVPRLKDQEEIRRVLTSAYGDLSEMMLYVHVPFCAQRCQFCEYTVVDPKQGTRDDFQSQYFDALMTEFDLYQELLNTQQKKLVGFDIGGGTPSMASIDNIARVMTKMQDCFQFDPNATTISIETTPKIAANEPEKIKAYYDMGIRRISMGVQTTDFALAQRLGRHDGDYLADSVRNIRAAGFSSFNVDLMYGFPLREDKEDKWTETVKNTISMLNPDHITLYRMRYKGTKMAHLQERVVSDHLNTSSGDSKEDLLGMKMFLTFYLRIMYLYRGYNR